MLQLFSSINFIKALIIIVSLVFTSAGFILLSGQKMEEETAIGDGKIKVRADRIREFLPYTPDTPDVLEESGTGQIIEAEFQKDILPISSPATETSMNNNETGLPLNLPAGFKIAHFNQSSLGPIRFMAFSPDNILFISMPSTVGLYQGKGGGKVYALPDKNKDGKADEVKTVFSGMQNLPHGLAFYKNYLYVAEENKITRYPYQGNGDIGAGEIVVPNLPWSDGEHSHISRTIGFSPSASSGQVKMYVSVGSSCNACEETTEGRAAILEYNSDGTGYKVFASGLRNTVGFVFHPTTGEIWGTDNGRDYLGDDLPPDEINVIREGKNYGWPKCYGKKISDPLFNDAAFCKTTESSFYDVQAHSATIGLRFINSSQFPSAWQGDLFVAYRGSWNRTVPTGYKIVRLDVSGNNIIGEEDFITGWLTSSGSKLGRPVDVIFGPDGELYISDDKTGMIYIVTKI